MKFMKKLKQFIITGVTATIMLSSSVAFASTTTDKLELMFNQIRNNTEFQDGQLFINAKFVTKSGLILKWDSETDSFVFGSDSGVSDHFVITPPANTTPITLPITNPESTPVDINNEEDTAYNNIFIKKDDLKPILKRDFKTKGGLEITVKNYKICLIYNGKQIFLENNEKYYDVYNNISYYSYNKLLNLFNKYDLDSLSKYKY